MKFAIGTAQWGMSYGINNLSGIAKDTDIKKINSFSKKQKIHMIDTASEYGNSEKKIGKLIGKDFKVVSKFGNITKHGNIGKQLNKSLSNLGLDKIYGYLFHDTNDLIKNLSYWDDLESLKLSGKISKIGYSIYEPKELDFLIEKNCIPDIVQFPFNILDRKFLNYFPILKKMNVEIHVRSIFLQGLFFMDFSNLKGNLNMLKRPLKIIEKIAKQNMIRVQDIALHYPFSIKDIDYMVVGVDNYIQLQQIVEKLDKPINKNVFKNIEEINLEEKEKPFLNPSNWKIK